MPLRVWSLYVPNGRTPDDPHYAYKLAWLAALTDHLGTQVKASAPLAVVGDFNVAPTDADVWDPALFADATHVTAPSARRSPRCGTSVSPTSSPGAQGRPPVHVLGLPRRRLPQGPWACGSTSSTPTPSLQSAVTDAYVDREARKGKGPSDHAPVVVDVDL